MAWGNQNSANACPCACRKRRLIMGYKLSYTTGLLHTWSSCLQWGVWVWTVGHWVVLVQVIYCSKGGSVLFSKEPTACRDQRSPWEKILSYSHSLKPDLSITHSSPLSTWLSILLFFVCRIQWSNVRGLAGNLSDLTVASSQYEILLCSETLVSDMRQVPEVLVPGFGRSVLLCRGKMPRARGIAAYVRDG